MVEQGLGFCEPISKRGLDVAKNSGRSDRRDRTEGMEMTAQQEAETARLEERTRIAQELHDTLLQTVQSASLHLRAALYCVAEDSPVKPQLDRILRIMLQGIAEGRDAIQGLRSPDNHASNPILALSKIRDDLDIQEDTEFCVTVTGTPTEFPQQIQHNIYRIGREALANAFHHSQAKRVELEAEYSGYGLCIRIRDNGCGMDNQVLEEGREGHWGLIAMRERAARIGARLSILSRPTQGTEVRLSIPTQDCVNDALTDFG
jgi:signal transduction histidine kinase